MQRRHQAEITTSQPQNPLWPFRVFYELLRVSLFIRLVADLPDPRAELERMSKNTEERLRECALPDLLEFLLGLKPRMLDASSLADAEAACEQLFTKVRDVDPSGAFSRR